MKKMIKVITALTNLARLLIAKIWNYIIRRKVSRIFFLIGTYQKLPNFMCQHKMNW